MSRRITALTVCALLIAAVPASAQTEIQLRYWPTSTTMTMGGATAGTWNTANVGLTVRRQFNPNWAVSFMGDLGGQSNWSGPALSGATAGTDGMWSLNLHRTWETGAGSFSLYAGYVSLWSNTLFPAVSATSRQEFRASGAQIGADFRREIASNLMLMLWAAYGLGLRGEYSWPGVTPSASADAGYYDYGAQISYMLTGHWTLDLGYRGLHMSGGAAPGWSAFESTSTGFLLGVSLTRP